ncbi:MAG: maleylpyruvate isomerase family mycothiol-dependent enzyme [Acidimicrobiia bacterium]
MLSFDRYLEYVRTNSVRLAEAAGNAGLDAAVPTCADWNVEQLVRHASRPLQWAAANVKAGGTMVQPADLERAPKGPEALPWFRAAADDCVAVLEAAGPDAPAWGWADDHHAAFWARRMAHEMAVHRYDAESAAGERRPIDGELAVDGIDEFLSLMAFHPAGGAAVGAGETIHLHCTDREGEWLLRRDAERLQVTRAHAKGDVAARGTASDLLLMLESRLPVTAVACFGDASLLERWQDEVSF